MARQTVVIQVEGVLRKPAGAVIESGRNLYAALSQHYRIVLVSEEDDRDQVSTWLSMEGFRTHDHLVCSGDWRPRHEAPWVATMLALKVSYGYPVSLVVVPSPADAADLIRHGYDTLLFTMAAYALPEWRPDHKAGIQPWEDLSEEVSRQEQIRAQDNRWEQATLW